MQDTITQDIKVFYDACTDTLNAKFILADAKIFKILKTIVSSSELIAVVGETLVKFNFENEFKKAQSKEDGVLCLRLPKEKSKLVAFVFSLLSEFDSHRLDLHTFVNDYYGGDEGNKLVECYEEFVRTVIYPFRDAMCELMGVNFEGEEDMMNKIEDADLETAGVVRQSVREPIVEDDEEDEQRDDLLSEFFADIQSILTQIQETINVDRKIKDDRRDELNITIEAIMLCLELGSLKILNALLISLNNLLIPIKSVKFYNMELQNRLLRFYDEIAE